MSAEAVLRVLKPGPFSLVQDLGRPGHRLGGVPEGGAMDRFALVAANLLVGNSEGAGALECALGGPDLVALRPCLVATTGADFAPSVNGQPVAGWTSHFLAPGDQLTFSGRRQGARCYVGVDGGLAGDRWLGSVATYLLVRRGGVEGRPLKAGDELGRAGPGVRPAVAGRFLPPAGRPAYASPARLAAVPGPHLSRLSPASRRALFRESFRVSRDADRMGFRLEGPPLEITGPELLSFGLAGGCLQVPASGQPILLMADHQTAGGYPVVAGVARADLPLAAQLLPGDELRFEKCGVEEAHQRWRRLRAGLETLRS